MKFVRFVENNDNEGETWNFWLQLDGNQNQLKELQSWLGTFDDLGEEYELEMEPVEESVIDSLVKYGGEGYMSYHNKVTGTFTLPKVTEKDEEDGYEWLNDNFYKGDIQRHFK